MNPISTKVLSIIQIDFKKILFPTFNDTRFNDLMSTLTLRSFFSIAQVTWPSPLGD